jgi:hypothetical protein
MDVQVKSLLNFSLPAVWTCAAWVSLSPPTINTSSIDVQGVSSQSGTGMNRNADYGTSLVPELGDPVRFRNAPVPKCSGTGLRYRMPECRCRRHRPRCRCPAMPFSVNREIFSALTQTAMKFVPHWLIFRPDVHVETVKIWTLAEHMRKFVWRWLQSAMKAFPRLFS